jgi:hypothetical protein
MSGCNTEIKHKENLFHVQIQDKGRGANYIESIIYKSGRVLTSKKIFYTSFLSNKNLGEKIQQLIKEQHNTVIKEIKEGKFDHL